MRPLSRPRRAPGLLFTLTCITLVVLFFVYSSEVPPGETLDSKIPGGNLLAAEIPVDEIPTSEIPVDEIPTSEMPVDEIPTTQTPRVYDLYAEMREKNGFNQYHSWTVAPSPKREMTFTEWRMGLWNLEGDYEQGCRIQQPNEAKSFFPAIKSAKVIDVCTVKSFTSLKDQILTIDCPEGGKPSYMTEPLPKVPPGKYPYPMINATAYTGPVKIDAELVVTHCNKQTNIATQIVPKPSAIERSRKMLKDFESEKKPPNLVIILFDTTSRAAFQRRMKHSIEYIQKLGIQKDSGVAVFEFFRYNVLGRSTSENVPQLELGCPPSPGAHTTTCQNVTALSAFMKDHGYVTGKSATHTVRANHYEYIPEINVDRHEDHFWILRGDDKADKTLGIIQHRDKIPNGEGVNWLPFSPNLRAHCLFGHFPADYFLHNLRQFFATYPKDVPKYFWVHILSNHMTEQTGLMDSDLKLVKTLMELPLEDTFVWLTADHGLTYGWEATPIGVQDHKNPLGILLAPRSYLTSEQETALLYNQHNLVTHYDIHTTFKELARMGAKNPPPEPIRAFNQKNAIPPFGLNILKEISPDRTCAEAGIAPQWCLCSHTTYESDVKIAEALRDVILDEISHRVEGEELCYDLRTLKKNFPPPKTYRVSEGKYFHAILEAVNFQSQIGRKLTFQGWVKVDDETGKFLVESIGRITEYGPEKCHPKLNKPSSKEYCACQTMHKFS
eukprot:TRINITY_DN2453_c0_g1_i3.p1 TRINITY_DN2453_c0_g1~~TRINITY_DN2453_c0_g1_i3.p1  ORF type:complete len:724 (-),score=92.30 TRINITY_DN2453_c0_g1_i3:1536-3707(-)